MKTNLHLMLCTGLLTLLTALPPSARGARDAAEAIVDQRRIETDRAALERDHEEAERFAALIKTLESARRERDLDRYLQVNTSLRGMMAREIDQARRRASTARAETGQSRREARAEVMEANATLLPGAGFQAPDDRRDQAASVSRAAEMTALVSRAEALLPRVEDADAEAFVDNGIVMKRFLAIVRADLAATQRELGEDLGERRNDPRK